MGLGKTLTMISLILKASEEEKNNFDSDDSSETLQRNSMYKQFNQEIKNQFLIF